MGFLQSASQIVLGVNFLFLLLLGFSFLFIEPGTGPFVIAVLTLIPVVLSLVASVAVIYTGWEPF
ncbi:hypothetical protein Htur_4450 (plasmid) [Haloterrigena turkmenica DSM 5511]|uniref:Uncharacterized protein n=1 Tax=Haloterrigena turkmenica (strain ATCC 51198 / DSM 5511 / JCM 9101 / NCIMB 13204 / VKM B-1734 / 4k) TaxID=543526 RepID=D2S1L4_HALTV|nr:hypothetical protein [Haloterrigena turkmenica]ADB63261.1 hypothetical protein Htur_4450 [Haloterrigena turkmenica DSM 5511]